MKKQINKKKLKKILLSVLCVVVVLSIIAGSVAFIANLPDKREPEFNKSSEKIEKQAFDEGEFKMGEYDLIVSPNGDDKADGTLEAPLKTLNGAKEKLKASDIPEGKKVTVWFREGTYTFFDTVAFDENDKDNVLYRSYPNEEVIFSGSKQIKGNWKETELNGVKAFVTDMPVESEDDYFRSLFKDGKRLNRSSYPKEEQLKVKDPKLDEAIAPEVDPDFFTHSVAFYADTKDILEFSNPEDIDIRLMHFWCDELMPVHSIDKETGRIETRKPSSMTIRVEDNFIFENVKEALSLPGEWYLDRAEEKLYYIPEENDTVKNTVLYAGVTEQLITINKAKSISFQGINFEKTDWDHTGKDYGFYGKAFPEDHPLYKNIEYSGVHPQAAFEVPASVYITESTEINFTDCNFENISYTAVKFDKASKDCNITSCLFNEIGGNAIFINGDFVVPATTENINVTDTHISNYGRIFNNAIGILLTHAIDCDLTHNEIHDGWYTGISVGWNWGYTDNPTNDINISNNLIYNIGNGWLSDMGAIYTLGIQPDTVISENVIYNVGCDEGRYGYGGWGIYLDEGSSEILVEKNLVYDCSSQTFHQHYGKDNMIRNNIFAFGGEGQFRITRNEDHNSLFLYNNILIGDDSVMYWNTISMDWFKDDNNLYWDYNTFGKTVFSGNSTSIFDSENILAMEGRGYYNNAILADPLFKDAQNRDFTLAENSPAFDGGFEPWEYNAGTITER
ncbi:MAG: right-handed parallel beta-helix repeat-containing protein [Clostridia bacterium]|nr:right-handed parallel beta-helix repeat-containing protein [Clostridia bacterium]